MSIRVRKDNGEYCSLKELIHEYKLLKENEISVHKNSLRAPKKLRKDYFLWNDLNSEILVCFSNEKKDGWYWCRLSSNIYHSTILSKILGEGSFTLKEMGGDIYKIIHPRK